MSSIKKELTQDQKKLGTQVNDIVRQAFNEIKDQVDVNVWKIIDRDHYESEEQRQATFEYTRTCFWVVNEVYLDPSSKSFKVRRKSNAPEVNQKSIKDILTNLSK